MLLRFCFHCWDLFPGTNKTRDKERKRRQTTKYKLGFNTRNEQTELLKLVKPSGAPRLPMRVLIYLSSLGDVKASWWNIQHDLFYLEGCWPFQLNVAFTNYCSLWCSSSNFIISPQKIQSNLMRCGQVENIYEMKFLIYNTKFSKETTIIFFIYIEGCIQ